MTDRLDLPLRYRHMAETLLREHVPNAEVWAFGSRISGESHEGSDLDLVLRSPTLEPLGTAFTELVEAFRESNIPILVQICDWATLSESFRKEIARDYSVLQEGTPRSQHSSTKMSKLAHFMFLRKLRERRSCEEKRREHLLQEMQKTPHLEKISHKHFREPSSRDRPQVNLVYRERHLQAVTIKASIGPILLVLFTVILNAASRGNNNLFDALNAVWQLIQANIVAGIAFALLAGVLVFFGGFLLGTFAVWPSVLAIDLEGIRHLSPQGLRYTHWSKVYMAYRGWVGTYDLYLVDGDNIQVCFFSRKTRDFLDEAIPLLIKYHQGTVLGKASATPCKNSDT